MTGPFESLVYERTVEGRRLSLVRPSALAAEHLRILLIVNGETPIGDLLKLVPNIDGRAVVSALLSAQLLQEVPREMDSQQELSPS